MAVQAQAGKEFPDTALQKGMSLLYMISCVWPLEESTWVQKGLLEVTFKLIYNLIIC